MRQAAGKLAVLCRVIFDVFRERPFRVFVAPKVDARLAIHFLQTFLFSAACSVHKMYFGQCNVSRDKLPLIGSCEIRGLPQDKDLGQGRGYFYTQRKGSHGNSASVISRLRYSNVIFSNGSFQAAPAII